MFQTQYQKGEYVIYGTNGICHIEGIEELSFSGDGKTRLYYIMKPAGVAASTLYVPLDNEALKSKIRHIMTADEINSLLSGTRGKQIAWIEDKNSRASYFHGVLSGGVNEDLLLMIRCIYTRKQQQMALGKKLASADEMVLTSAEKLVREEFSYALGMKTDAVDEYIKSIVE